MFAIKGRLKVTLVLFLVLAVGFGMYSALQIQEADGHWLVTHTHKYKNSKDLFSDKTDDDAEMDCSSCGKKRPAKKRVREYHTWKHKWHCHWDDIAWTWVYMYVVESEYAGVYTETNWVPKGSCPNSDCTTNNN